MRILVDLVDDSPAKLAIHESDDFRHFGVVIKPTAELVPGEVLSDAIRVESADRVWVDPEWLRVAARCTTGERADALESMISFAQERDWIDAESGEIAAHVERRPWPLS